MQLNRWRATLYYSLSNAEGGRLITVLRVLRQERDVGLEDLEGDG